MREKSRFFILLLVLFFGVVWVANGQLQQSGGPGSVITFGSPQHVIVDTAPTTAVTIGALPALAAGSAVIGHVIVDTVPTTAVTIASLPALASGSNLVGYTRVGNACGTTTYESGMQYLPLASTQLTATATCITVVMFTNTDTVAHSVDLQDQSTACNSGVCNVLKAFSIPAASQMDVPLYGTKFTGGIKFDADLANKVVVNVIGNQ